MLVVAVRRVQAPLAGLLAHAVVATEGSIRRPEVEVAFSSGTDDDP